MNENNVLQAVLEQIEKREAKLYKQKQKAISEIFKRAKKEDWISVIAESKSGKRFLLELAVKSCDISLTRLLPEKHENKHSFEEGDPLIIAIRQFLQGEDGKE